MTRAHVQSILLLLIAGCGAKTNQSVCDQVGLAANAVCSETCDPNGANSCPAGYHCTGDGHCDAQCDDAVPCPTGYACSADGTCVSTDMNGGTPDAAACPAINFTAMPTIPSIELVVDRSGSMDGTDISPTRYQAIETGLVGAQGVVTTDQANVYFGAAEFAGDQDQPACLNLNGFTVPRALNNGNAITALLMAHPPHGGSTPTAPAIDQTVTDFATNPPPAGSPPIILLATDGEPNACGNGQDNGASVASAKAAYAAGIRLFILGLALPGDNQYLQDMANAGQGVTAGMPDAPFFTADNPAQLATALNSIINGVLSCDLTINAGGTQTIDPATASGGTVTLDGMNLTFGTDWTVINGSTIELQGAACTKLKNDTNPVLTASFPCGAIIP